MKLIKPKGNYKKIKLNKNKLSANLFKIIRIDSAFLISIIKLIYIRLTNKNHRNSIRISIKAPFFKEIKILIYQISKLPILNHSS
jgi:hypothetical protein